MPKKTCSSPSPARTYKTKWIDKIVIVTFKAAYEQDGSTLDTSIPFHKVNILLWYLAIFGNGSAPKSRDSNLES
ncbi:unnamed protein product [Allacma fusca]|uniref:Uncharacterized protein n=1 Tax=Allacma fusca TaxID=39272 RepID=A0A8J2NHR4_9HEXA|nr:unnamed protein product [Allacma fusca]